MAAVALGVAAIGAVGAASAAPPVMPGLNEMFADTKFDSSGWNVAFPGAKIESSRSESAAAVDPVAAVIGGGYMPWVVLGAGVLLLWRMGKK